MSHTIDYILWISLGITMIVLSLKLLIWLVGWFLKWGENVGNLKLPPFRIKLMPTHDTEWIDAEGVKEIVESLIAMGFVRVGIWEVRPMEETHVCGLVQKEMAITAAVYRAGKMVAVDLTSRYEDDSDVTYCNIATGQEFKRPPTSPVVRMPGTTAEQLYHAMLDGRPRRPLKVPDPKRFASDYEDSYAAVQNWNAERGGPTVEEIRNVIIATGKKPTPIQVEECRRQIADAAFKNWWKLIPHPPAPWEEVHDVLLVVHDEIDTWNLAYQFSKWTGDWDVSEEDFPKGFPPRNAFTEVNSKKGKPLVKVYEKTSEPPADYYVPRDLDVSEADSRTS